MDDSKANQRLQDMVNNIAHNIQYGMTYDEAGMDHKLYTYDGSPDDYITGMDYLQDCLDIQYIVTGASEYLGARVLVAFGGPNIWINTQSELVEGYWWGDYAAARIDGDSLGLDEALQELWECR
jgi:hypothetical protein